MKYIIILFFLIISIKVYPQKSINEYTYVVVPDKFEFLKEKDKYQLNSLTEFLFNKYGFNAYLGSEVPKLNICDGLYADVLNDWALMTTRVLVVLRDCNGNEIFRSKEGVSREKASKVAYQLSLREAFESIQQLNVIQKKPTVNQTLEVSTTPQKVTSEVKKVEVKAPVKTEAIPVSKTVSVSKEETKVDKNISLQNLPKSKFSYYSNNGKSYLLRKDANGYFLYEESTTTEGELTLKGSIKITESEIYFEDNNGIRSDALFDTSENLVLFVDNKATTFIPVR